MIKKLLILALLLCVAPAFSQQKLKKADKLFAVFAYAEAAPAYEEYLAAEKKPQPEVMSHAADAYYYTGKMQQAAHWYAKLYAAQDTATATDSFNRYIQSLRATEQYSKADELLWSYLQANGNTVLMARLKAQKAQLDSLNALPFKHMVTNLPGNTAAADFGTAYFKDKVVFASAKDSVRDGAKVYAWNAQPYLSLFVAQPNADGSLGNEKKFLNNAQTGYHNAAVAFSPDYETVYVSVNNVNSLDKLQDDKKGTNNIQLVYGGVQGERLVKKQVAPFNSKEYSVGQPAVSNDGKWLFFISDMPGGYGGTDIYAAPITEGTLGTPVNLGPVVNTTGNEMFPFIKDATLYFASNGHYGLGGLDVFKSTYSSDFTFSEPQNLGRPFNSNRDDFAYITNNGGTTGYLSSNRAGGRGDDDIYYFSPDTSPCSQVITGIIVNKMSRQPIQGAQVKVSYGATVFEDTTKADGTYTLTVPCDAVLAVEATKPEYSQGKITANSSDSPEKVKADFELSAYADLVKKEADIEKVAINPIYFDFDQYYITPQAAAELDKVVFVMQNFPDVVIKIESHTDARGEDSYNFTLSNDRAKSTYSYIVSKGIDPTRIESVQGFGETRLINKCANGIDCTDEEHQLNRRSDFIVVKK